MTCLDDKLLYLIYAGSLIKTTKFKGIYFPKFQNYSDTKKYHSYGDKFWIEDMYSLSQSMYYT